MKKQTEVLIEYLRSSNSSKREPSSIKRTIAASEYDKDLYQQLTYQIDDPYGDEVLIQRSSQVPKNLLKFFKKKAKSNDNEEDSADQKSGWIPEDWELEDPFPQLDQVSSTDKSLVSIQGRNNPIHVDNMVLALSQLMQEEYLRSGIRPLQGTIHVWSNEVLQKYRGRSLVLILDKIFVALCLGFTNRFMMTGTELELREWILQQPMDSIAIIDMFRQSYRLNNGDVYLTILTIENVLASNWRYAGRESLPVTKRLKPITSGYNYNQDRYGTWYHFFGMMLYGYTTNSSFKANIVGRIEALGSNIMSLGRKVDKTQKQWMNKKGGAVGDQLRQVVQNRTWQNLDIQLDRYDDKFYLILNEDFRDRLKYNLSRELHAEAWGQLGQLDTVRITSLSQDLKGCQIDMMYDTGYGFDSRNISVFKDQTLELNKQTMFIVSKKEIKSARIFVYNCQSTSQTHVLEVILPSSPLHQ